MLLYYLFWMFMGFTLHFYIIFGTNLLIEGPSRIAVFCLFQCFEENECQTECKRNETFESVIFGTNVIERTWSESQEAVEAATRVEGAPPTGRAPYLVGPLGVHRPTSSSYIYPRTPKTSKETTKNYFHHRNLLYPLNPILEPLPALRRRGNRPWRASTSTPCSPRSSWRSIRCNSFCGAFVEIR